MRKNRIGAVVAIAATIAVAGTGVGFAAPPANQHLATATSSAVASVPPGVAKGPGATIALKKASAKKVTATNLNLRQGTNTKSKVLATIPKNTTITVTETRGTWSKTKCRNKTGWVASAYLKNVPAPKKSAAKPKAAHLYTTGFTTLHKAASTKSAALSVHQRRTKVESISVSGSWTKVKVAGKTGYIPSTRLSKSNPGIVHRWLKSKQLVHGKTSNKSATVTTVQKGTKVEWLRSNGSWTGIRTSKGNGWVPTSTLASAAPRSSAQPPAKASYRWTSSKVNLRKGAGTSHPSLGLVPLNERVTYLKGANGWSNVKTSKGTGWISNQYLRTSGQYPFAVYGTLRKGQSAYHVLKGRTTKETKTKVPSFNMYLKPSQTWWSFIIPSTSASNTVVVERMEIKPELYNSTVKNLDSWERFDPGKPLADQSYNRKLVTDQDGHQSWAYVGASKISKYLTKNGIRVTSGDYLKRY